MLKRHRTRHRLQCHTLKNVLRRMCIPHDEPSSRAQPLPSGKEMAKDGFMIKRHDTPATDANGKPDMWKCIA